MRIGVKYCGGCNPRYDRVALVERIQRGQPEDIFEGAIPGVCYDQLLVVCGCSAQCAGREDLDGEVLVLWSPEQFDQAARRLQTL